MQNWEYDKFRAACAAQGITAHSVFLAAARDVIAAWEAGGGASCTASQARFCPPGYICAYPSRLAPCVWVRNRDTGGGIAAVALPKVSTAAGENFKKGLTAYLKSDIL